MNDQVVDGVVIGSVVVVLVVALVSVAVAVLVRGLHKDLPNRLNEESIESEIELRELLLVLTESGALSLPFVEKSFQVLPKSVGFVFHMLLEYESFHREFD